MPRKSVWVPEKRVYCVAEGAQRTGSALYYEKYTEAFDTVATCNN